MIMLISNFIQGIFNTQTGGNVKRIALLFTALFLTAATASAQYGDLNLNLGAGMNFPLTPSELSENYGNAPRAGVKVGMYVTPGIEFEAGAFYNSFSADEINEAGVEDVTAKVWIFTIGVKNYLQSRSNLTPFVFAGAGLYQATVEATDYRPLLDNDDFIGVTGDTESELVFSDEESGSIVYAGGGVEYALASKYSLFAMGELQLLFLESGTSVLIPVTVGLKISLL